MLEFDFAVFAGTVWCLVMAVWIGLLAVRRRGRTGPNSRVPVSESVVPIVKKG